MFARRSNASIDRPIMRKSMAYLEMQVGEGQADWVDSAEKRSGIIARDLLYFGPRDLPPSSDSYIGLPPVELPGIRFVPPAGLPSWLPYAYLALSI